MGNNNGPRVQNTFISTYTDQIHAHLRQVYFQDVLGKLVITALLHSQVAGKQGQVNEQVYGETTLQRPIDLSLKSEHRAWTEQHVFIKVRKRT